MDFSSLLTLLGNVGAGMAATNNYGGGFAYGANKFNQDQQYGKALNGLFGQQMPNPVAVTPPITQPGEYDARKAAGVYSQPDSSFTGPLGKAYGSSAGQMYDFYKNMPADMAMPLLLKSMGNLNPEYDTTPRVGVNPATGQREQFVMDKMGHPKWLGIAPETKIEWQNGVAVDPYGTKPGSVINDPNKPFSPGGAPNKAFQDYSLKERAAGRPVTSVNVTADKSFGSQLGENAGKILDTSHAAALGGIQTIDTANRIRAALDSGKVTAGPGATFVQTFNQITGGDQNKLVETRKTIQGLAQLTLAARGALKGQGQISDYEGKLLAKASSGDIDSMTVPEIRAIADVADRAARISIKQNADNVSKARLAAPGNQSLVDFYNVDEPPAYKSQAPIDDLVNKYLGNR